MPNVITGNYNNVIDSTLLSKDLDYDYPYDLNLRPGSKTHEIIKNAVLRRARESHSLISDRIPSWNRTEKIMTAYIDLSEDEKNLQDTDGRKPVSIVFPYSYVIIETVLTYLIMAFLQDPILRYGGVSSEDTIGAIMLESTIQHQCNKFKVALALHTFLRDSLVYGIGIGAPIWQKVTGMVIREDTSSFMSFFKGRGKRSYTEEVVYEGNKLENVDPYLYLPDPRVPSHKIQEGEYVGWIDLTSRISLLREEKISDDI